MINRRKFLTQTAQAGIISFMPLHLFIFQNESVFGHNNKKYKWDQNWKLHFRNTDHPVKVKDCHEMVCLRNGEMILLTNHPENNIIRFNAKGEVLFAGCTHFPGAHGLSLGYDANDLPYLVITDTDLHKVFITDLEGNIRSSFVPVADGVRYINDKEFVPTETAITKDGDIYIADGYGKQYIHHISKDGNVLNIFGGRGEKVQNLDNAHGVCVDYRGETPELIITDRNRCCFKRFTLKGEYISTIELPGANVCRPVIHGKHLYAAVLTTNHTGNSNTGFVVILDQKDRLVSCIGGSDPLYKDKKLQASYQTVMVFKHPHDVMVDNSGNLYVCQWNSNQVLPYKFNPV
jgi:peptidylamidoglycolate lyase